MAWVFLPFLIISFVIAAKSLRLSSSSRLLMHDAVYPGTGLMPVIRSEYLLKAAILSAPAEQLVENINIKRKISEKQAGSLYVE